MKYIDVDLLRKEVEFAKSVYDNPKRAVHGVADAFRQDGRAAMCDDILKILDSLQQEQPEVGLFECPKTPIKDAIEVTSRLRYIDADLKPIAEFIMDYASWNLHKDEWNQPTIEVPLFRVLDALAQRGEPYCCGA